MTESRARFDADLVFRNGGGLQAQDFRLDIPRPDVTEEELGALFVRHLGLLMVDEVRVRGVQVFAERPKGSRGGPADPDGKRAPDKGRLVELSHVIEDGMITYPGLPGPEITPHLTREASRVRYAAGTEFAIDRINMVGNTGTYLDSPYHRYADGADLASLPLTSLVDLPLMVVRLTGSNRRPIEPPALAPCDVAGAAVLIQTGWDRHWRTPAYAVDAPYLTEAGAQLLAESGARLVGIDSVNIDSTDGGERPAHSILLAAGIPILEHLTGLDQLPVSGARLHAAPPRVRGLGTFPVRVYAITPQE